jgi:hypothetical protein
LLAEAPASQPKFTKSFGNSVFEGEGDAFLRKRIKEMHAHRSLNITPENREGTIPMCEGGAFEGISLH